MEASNVKVKNCNSGVVLAGCSLFNARSIAIDSCMCGVEASHNNLADLVLASIKNCNIGIRVLSGGGVISTTSAVFENNTTNCNIPFNQVTANGIVFN